LNVALARLVDLKAALLGGDARAMLEPAGAISIAGAKKFIASLPTRADGSKGNFIAISSDASNIEFGILRFIADRASIGEQTEALFAPTPHSSRLTPHASLLTPHASRLTPHASRLTPHASRITHHASRLTPYHSLPLP